MESLKQTMLIATIIRDMLTSVCFMISVASVYMCKYCSLCHVTQSYARTFLFLVLQVEYYPYIFVDYVSDKSIEYCKVTFIIY